MKNNLPKILATVFIIAAGAGFLIYSSKADAQYYKKVDEVMEEPAKWVGKSMQVHGYVKAGSIKEEIVEQKTLRTFVLEDEHKHVSIRVKHEGPKPDTFKDLSEVVAKGRLVKDGDGYVLEATDLMAKCPSKYEGAARNKKLDDKRPVF
jgi:cytochrome c-type biogenesis protein CcmE